MSTHYSMYEFAHQIIETHQSGQDGETDAAHLLAMAKFWMMFDEIRGSIHPTCPMVIIKMDAIRSELLGRDELEMKP